MAVAAETRWCRLAPGLVLLAAAPALRFAAVEAREHGWLGLHRYGPAPGGLNWVQLMPRKEALLAVTLPWLVPLAVAAGVWIACRPWWRRVSIVLAWRWRRVAVAAALVAVTGSLAVSHLVIQRTPLTDDEHAYLFQARIFALGRLTWESPPEKALFENRFIIDTGGRWYAQYPPGHPALLALGVRLGDPWLVPALAAGLTVLLLAASTRRLFGRSAAAWAAVLAASSPFLLAVSGTLLSHATCLAVLAAFLWTALAAAGRRAHWGWALAAAMLFGLAVLVRPFTALAVGLPLTGLAVVRWWRSGRRRETVVAYAAGGAVMLALQLWLNWRMNGNPFYSGYIVYWLPKEGWRSPFGFGTFPWGIVHTPETGIANLWHAVVRLDTWLLGWPLSLAPVALGAVWLRRRLETPWLLATAMLSPLLYVFYFWPGIADVGPVLLTETMVGLVPLAGAGIGAAPRRLRTLLGAVALASILLAVPSFDRVQAGQLGVTAANARAPFVAAVRAIRGRAVVLVPETLGPPRPRSWVSGRPNPWPDLRDRILFLRDTGDPDIVARVGRCCPGRWILRLCWDPRSGFFVEPAGTTKNGPPGAGRGQD